MTRQVLQQCTAVFTWSKQLHSTQECLQARGQISNNSFKTVNMSETIQRHLICYRTWLQTLQIVLKNYTR